MVLARLWELFRLSSIVKRVEMTTCSGKTTVFMYIGVTNHVTFVHSCRSNNQLSSRCVFICHHITFMRGTISPG